MGRRAGGGSRRDDQMDQDHMDRGAYAKEHTRQPVMLLIQTGAGLAPSMSWFARLLVQMASFWTTSIRSIATWSGCRRLV